MAYTVGYEHTSASVNGEPRTYTLRVTQVYRREDGEWKVAHRHARHGAGGVGLTAGTCRRYAGQSCAGHWYRSGPSPRFIATAAHQDPQSCMINPQLTM